MAAEAADLSGCCALVAEFSQFLRSARASCPPKGRHTSLSANVSQLLALSTPGAGHSPPPSPAASAPSACLSGSPPLLHWPALTRGDLVRPDCADEAAAYADAARSAGAEVLGAVAVGVTALERVLVALYYSAGGPRPAPRVLRDLLDAPQTLAALGPDKLFFVKALVGPPIGINLRNVVWHGFLSPGEAPPEYAALLAVLLLSLPPAAPGPALSPSSAEPAPAALPSPDVCLSAADLPCLAQLFRQSAFVIGSREDAVEEAFRALLEPRPEPAEWRAELCCSLLLPQLEHCLRRAFVSANGLPPRMMSPDFRAYYTTMDIVLQEKVVRQGDQLIAASAVAGTRFRSPKFAEGGTGSGSSPSPSPSPAPGDGAPNELRALLGDHALCALHDLLTHARGPRLRDCASHGVADYAQALRSGAVAHACGLFAALSASMAPGCQLSPGVLSAREFFCERYASVFHPAACALSDAAASAAAIRASRDAVSATLCGAPREYADRRARALAEGPAGEEDPLGGPRAALCTLYCSAARISVAAACTQIARAASDLAQQLQQRAGDLTARVAAGSAGRRAEDSLYRLCAAVDEALGRCVQACGLARGLVAATDCARAGASDRRCAAALKLARAALTAVEKASARAADGRWPDMCAEAAALDAPAAKMVMPLTREQIGRGVGKCLNTMNYILIGACALLFVGGLALFSVGVATRVSEEATNALGVPGVESLPTGFIVIGIFICVLSIFGIVGAVLWNRALLAIFTVLLGILVICQLGVGIAGACSYNDLPKHISSAWSRASDKTKAALQIEYACCGYWNKTDRPAQMLLNATTKVDVCLQQEDPVRGCKEPIWDVLSSSADKVGGAGIALSVLEIVGFAVTIALMVRVRQVIVRHELLPDEPTDPVGGM
eukprot:m51a1_g541 hypothetical protein (899) ;mRNA; r:419594-423340